MVVVLRGSCVGGSGVIITGSGGVWVGVSSSVGDKVGGVVGVTGGRGRTGGAGGAGGQLLGLTNCHASRLPVSPRAGKLWM